MHDYQWLTGVSCVFKNSSRAKLMCRGYVLPKSWFGQCCIHFGDEKVAEVILTVWMASILEMSNDGC